MNYRRQRLRMVADRQFGLDANDQIASVVRKLRGHVTRAEVALFFRLHPKMVTAIWTGERYPQLTDNGEPDGQPVSAFGFPYLVYFDEDIRPYLNEVCTMGRGYALPRPSRF